MTKQEHQAWTNETARSENTWRTDPCHNGCSGRDMLLYKGGVAGSYLTVDRTGRVSTGTYDHAMPHIGEAEFTEQHHADIGNFDTALKMVVEALGSAALVTIANLDAATGCAPMQS